MNQTTIEPNTLPVEISGEVSSMEAWAQSLVIENGEQRTAAIETVRTCKDRRSKIVAFFAESKSKAHAAWKSIVASESRFTDKLDFVESKVRTAIRVFDQAEESKRLAEQKRLQDIADAAAQKERDRLEKEAAKLKTPELKEARLAQAAAVAAPVVRVAVPTAPVSGTSTRKIWKARVVDAAQVPREFVTVNQSALDAFARATKGATQVAGVEFYEDSSLTIGR